MNSYSRLKLRNAKLNLEIQKLRRGQKKPVSQNENVHEWVNSSDTVIGRVIPGTNPRLVDPKRFPTYDSTGLNEEYVYGEEAAKDYILDEIKEIEDGARGVTRERINSIRLMLDTMFAKKETR